MRGNHSTTGSAANESGRFREVLRPRGQCSPATPKSQSGLYPESPRHAQMNICHTCCLRGLEPSQREVLNDRMDWTPISSSFSIALA